MIKVQKHIAVVRSSIPALSSMSQRSCDAIVSVLEKRYARVSVHSIDSQADLEIVVDCSPDLVFMGMKYVPLKNQPTNTNDGRLWLAQFFDEHDIAYTGSNQLAHQRELNKDQAKRVVRDAGLSTAEYLVIRSSHLPAEDSVTLNYPLFIKPTNRGGGLGIDSGSIAHDYESLIAKVYSIAKQLNEDSLVEEYLPGREFSVAILANVASNDYQIMPVELIAMADTEGRRVLGAREKAANLEQAVAVIDEDVKMQVEELALQSFQALGARDYGRIDIRLDFHGKPQFLEANLIPSLISGYGSFPKACVLNMQLGYEAMLLQIVRLGLHRSIVAADSMAARYLAAPQTVVNN